MPTLCWPIALLGLHPVTAFNSPYPYGSSNLHGYAPRNTTPILTMALNPALLLCELSSFICLRLSPSSPFSQLFYHPTLSLRCLNLTKFLIRLCGLSGSSPKFHLHLILNFLSSKLSPNIILLAFNITF